MEYEPTGIAGLDEILKGGFPKGSIVLVAGAPGTGKSLFARQFANIGAKKFEQKCMYVSLEQKTPEIHEEAKLFGMNFKEHEKNGRLKTWFFDIASRQVPAHETHISLLKKEAKDFGAERLVIDSLNPFADFPISFDELIHYGFLGEMDKVILPTIREGLIVRMQVHKLMTALKELNCTTVVISEIPKNSHSFSRDGVSEFMADGVIVLTSNENGRFMTVEKMRKVRHTTDALPLEISQTGMKIKE